MPFDSYPLLVARAPALTPTIFTNIAELEIPALPDVSSNEYDSSTQNHSIDVYVVSTLIRRKPVPLTLNMLPSDPTQDHVAGLYNARFTNSFDGYKFSHAASGLVWVASGYVTALGPPKIAMEGKMQLPVTLRLSGPMGIQSNSAGGMLQIGT
jgi:hypothetical protein